MALQWISLSACLRLILSARMDVCIASLGADLERCLAPPGSDPAAIPPPGDASWSREAALGGGPLEPACSLAVCRRLKAGPKSPLSAPSKVARRRRNSAGP